jgi:hypothetical protein
LPYWIAAGLQSCLMLRQPADICFA